MQISIVPMQDRHFNAIKEIEHKVHAHPWSDKHLLDINGRFHCHYVLLKGNKVIGYYYAQNIAGEITLLNIAISPNEQGNGYGAYLLEQLLEYAHNQEAESIWLEVRESNIKALSLYRTFEFNEVTRRLDYYPTKNGREDAIVMSLSLLFKL